MAATYASAQTRCHAHRNLIHPSPHTLAHGEHDRLGSVITIFHQVAGSAGYLIIGVVIHRHHLLLYASRLASLLRMAIFVGVYPIFSYKALAARL